MRMFKALVSAFTLLAVAVYPVAAAWMPCCCSQQDRVPSVQTTHPCCDALEKASAGHACLKSDRRALPSVAVDSHGCCCFQALPVATPRDSDSKLPAGQHSWVADLPVADRLLAPVSGFLNDSWGHFSLSGPPLLALYCTWVK